MAIYLITGSPGAGKTLYAVKTIVEKLLKENRPVFSDIAGLDHVTLGTFELKSPDGEPTARHWQTVPDGAILVLDEVQRAFPPRNPASKVPDYIQAFETHRHRGIDLYLLTQHPRLIDGHIKPLVERHYHLHRSYGLKRSTILQWEGVSDDPSPSNSSANAAREAFSFPAKMFKYYRSASLHTHKPKLPVKALAYVAIAGLMLAFAGWKIVDRFTAPRVELTTYSQQNSTQLAAITAVDGQCAVAVGMVGDRLIYQLQDGSKFLWRTVVQGEEVREGIKRC